MTTPPRARSRLWPRAIRWTLSIGVVLAFLVVSALLVGGWWLEHRTLRQEFHFGGGEGKNRESTLRVYGGRFTWWALRVDADSVWFRSPGLDARVGALSADADLFAGLLSFKPAAAITADSTWLRLRSDTAKKEPTSLDSLVFKDFALPLALSVRLRRLEVEDDSGWMAAVDTLRVRNGSARKANAQARAVRTRWTRGIPFSLWAYADWSIRDSVLLNAGVRRGEDYVTVKGRHAKNPLWKGHDALEASIAESAPYVRALTAGAGGKGTAKDAKDIPRARNLRVTASAQVSKHPVVDLKLTGEVAAWRMSDAFALSAQAVQVTAGWKDGSGEARVESRGAADEDLLLRARARALPGFGKGLTGSGSPKSSKEAPQDSLSIWTLLESLTLSLDGHARGFRVKVNDTVRTADLEIRKADWDGKKLAVALVTGDDSRIEASGQHAKTGAWSAAFSVNVQPRERWVKVFAGDKVAFDALQVDGEAAGNTAARTKKDAGSIPTVKATVAARKLSAYGVTLDSLRSWHEYGPSGYVLKPSRLYAKKTAWTLEGSVRPALLTFRLSSPRHGSLQFDRDAGGTMKARAELFDAGALPYAYLDSLPFDKPVIDGTFEWNPARKTGRADLGAQGRYKARSKAEDVEVRVKGAWDARRMDLEEASARMAGSELRIAARARLNGKQFYEVWKVKPAQYEYASVRTSGLDIARVMKVFQPEPALSKGSVEGELSYGDKTGFEGQLTFKSITPREAVGDVVLKELSLEGNGDTLFVSARTTSASVKPLNARLRLAVSSLLKNEQHVRADLVAGDSLRVRLEAVTQRFQSLRGTLDAEGKAVLPEKSGSVEDIRIGLDFDVPLADPLNRASLKSRAFQGVYVLPGLSRQTFDLNPSLSGGVFRVPRFSIRNAQGQTVSGSLEYGLARGALKAHLEGDRFEAAWADDYKVDVRSLTFDITRDAQGLRLSGGFSSAAFLYVDAPLYARGTLSAVRLAYDKPVGISTPGSPRPRRAGLDASGAVPTLTFSGNLSGSLIRYRLKTFADLQKLLARDRKRRAQPIRLNVKVQTLGNDNHIDSDLLRLTWVGDLSVRGTNPYTLFNGRVNSLDGGLGLDKQAYGVARFEVKWLNAPMEEGIVHMEARKKLASDCVRRNEPDVDSCTVITHLDGELNEMKFSYDTDCGGAYGAGGNVAAILYSVQRGCYDASLVTGGDGRGYGNKALTLLEPTLNRSLSTVVGRYSGNWIEATEVSGLGSLSGENGASGDTLGEALSLGLTSKEYMRLRLQLRSGYHTASPDLSNPWEHMVALEWRPPADRLVRSERWKRRLNENLRAVASLQTLPVRVNEPQEDEIEKKISLIYSYAFWGSWCSKPRKPEKTVETPAAPAQGTGEGAGK